MSTVTVSARLPDKEVRKFDQLAQQQGLDRSSLLKSLLRKGLKAALLDEAIEAYREGRVTMSRACEIAEIEMWDFISLMPAHGLELNYGMEELREDLA